MRYLGLGAAMLLGACSSTPPCEDDVEAFVMAQTFVSQSLRAPATAEFPSLGDEGTSSNRTVMADGSCAFNVRIFVDAQNGFGAMIREHYFVTVAPDGGDSWRLIGISPS